jgi:NAD+ synthase
MKKYEQIVDYLCNFLSVEVAKTGLNRVVLGLSGGIDSAVVALLAHKIFGDNLLCVRLPSRYSSQSSLDDADELCRNFGIKYITLSIDPMLRAYEELNPDMDNLRRGNLSARLRMTTLFDLSAKYNALVLGTGNKSEIMLGYGTLYGDTACALNPIGDLYKSDIYKLAELLGVPESIIKKAPSADLWAGQSDEAELGYSYAMLDEVLNLYVEENIAKDEIVKRGYNIDMLDMITERIARNEFKRKMPPIAKINRLDLDHERE